MLVSSYREALVEVLEILKHAKKEDVDKIPKNLLLFFKRNASPTYKFTFDQNKQLKDLNLRDETKGLLAMIYRSYWCTPEERAEYDKLLIKNQKLYDEMLREKYNPDKIFENNFYQNTFENKNQETSQAEESNQENQSLIIYPQNIFARIIEKLREFFEKFHFKSKSI